MVWRQLCLTACLLASSIAGLAGCGGEAETPDPIVPGEAEGGLVGKVRIDGDPDFCYDNGTVCDDGVLSHGSSTGTLEGIIGTVGWLGGCSATLVTPIHVLTAAHCLDGRPPSGYVVHFPQGGDPAGSDYPVDSFVMVGTNTINHHTMGRDIALLKLQRPVPPTVVANPAPVWTGKIADGLSWSEGTYAVGFGHPNLGKRQYGRVRGAFRLSDPCDKIQPFEGYCQDSPTINARRDNETTTRGGDSGGPLFVKVDGTFYLIGVASGHHDYLTWDGYFEDQVWAPVGKPTEVAKTITALLEGDRDGDGVNDDVDNCPPAACRFPLACQNPDQKDSDGDGWGDACDNCPSIVNVEQRDWDRDGHGDVCDKCPKVASANNLDSDGDGVGDVCEQCVAYGERLPCTSDATCRAKNAGTCMWDVDGNGAPILPGLCSNEADDDGDGVPQSCDFCRNLKDADNRNANMAIEFEWHVEHRGDRCDPVPQLAFEVPGVRYEKALVPKQGTGREGLDWVQIWTEVVFADDGTLVEDDFTQPVSFRHCSCIDVSGRRIPEEACVRLATCKPSLAEKLGGEWKEINPVTGGKAAPVDIHFDSSQTPHAGPGFVWNWLLDTGRSVDPIGHSVDPTTKLVTTHGLVATVVERQDDLIASNRDGALTKPLRTVVDLVTTPNHTTYSLADDWVVGPCGFPACMWWIPDLRHIYEPWEWLTDVLNPGVLSIHDAKLGLIFEEMAVDLSERIDPAMQALLESGSWSFVPNAEPSRMLAQAGRVAGALVPHEGAGFKGPLRVIVKGGRFLLEGSPVLDEEGNSLGVLAASGGAVYSARENAVYLLGGSTATGLAGLRRYDLESGRATALDVEAAEGRVAAMTLDAENGRLYALFVDDGAGTWRARIASVEVGTGASVELLQVPVEDPASHFGLSFEAGNLAVFGERGNTVGGWLYRTSDGRDLTFVGSWESGRKLVGPSHPNRLSVVTEWDGKFSVEHLRIGDFAGKDPLFHL